VHGATLSIHRTRVARWRVLTAPRAWGVLEGASLIAPQQGWTPMLELSLWVLGAVLVLGLVACRLARRPRKQHDMELLDFDFDKSKSYEKDGRKYPFSY
jgi:hypothetical protein